MSEYKFYCPQCGQHILCDTGHSGMQINCPVCQQKIIVPQAPAAIPILPQPAPVYAPPPTGAAPAGGRPYPVNPVAQPAGLANSRALKNSLLVVAAVLALAGLGVGGWWAYSKLKLRQNPVLTTPNLLGYWRFNATSQANSCVNGYTGTLQGNAQLAAAAAGRPLAADSGNQALVLDGMNSYVATSLTGQISNQGTILAWVYLATPPAGGQIFSVVSQSQSGNDYDLEIREGGQIYFFTDAGSCTISSQALPPNQWHFLAATFTANAARCIYLDGQLAGSTPCGGHFLNSSPFWFGNCRSFGPRCFQGQFAEVAIFNRALSADEIKDIYTAQK
jgi:hypothetical protein